MTQGAGSLGATFALVGQVCAVWALAASVARADLPRIEGPAMTALAAGELGRSTHVAVGSVQSLREVRGTSIARVVVERWLRGDGEAGSITVLVAGPRAGADPRQPSVPLLQRGARTSYVFFLSQRRAGEAFTLENRQVVEGLEGVEKVRAVEAQVRLAEIVDAEERARRVLAHFLAALDSKGAWTRANAARELNHLGTVRPDVFSRTLRARLAAAADGPAAPTVRAWLRSLVRYLEVCPLPAERVEPGIPLAAPLVPVPVRPPILADPVAEESPEEAVARLDALLVAAGAEAPTQALRLLKRLEDAAQRAWVVGWLAESGHRETLSELRALYAREESPEVREAMVRAHGLLGSDADVPWLGERLTNRRLVEAALLALARIRTPRARAALETFRNQHVNGREDDQELATKVEHLLSAAFEEAERFAAPVPPEESIPALR